MTPAGFSGVVLAGGKSSRMGRDKATLFVAGETLLARQLRLLAEAGGAELLVSAACATLESPAWHLSRLENSEKEPTKLEASRTRPLGSVRSRRSAGILPAGSGGILPPEPSFQTGS